MNYLQYKFSLVGRGRVTQETGCLTQITEYEMLVCLTIDA